MRTFEESIEIVDLANAEYFAADLFAECFGTAFPSPPDCSDPAVPPDPRTWHQYVAFYKWAENQFEAVGFCNWQRYGDVYLEGGMCVRPNFYRRLPKDHWLQCKQLGGIAQLLMEAAAMKLNDADAWFGYCGDKKAYAVDMRIGYRPTRHKFVIVKWFRDLSPARQTDLENEIAALGPF